MKTIVNPHDKFFKEMLSRVDRAREFIAKALPAEIADRLDLENLRLDPNSYIDGRLETGFSDVVYDCHYKGLIRTKVALLFEHKSRAAAHPHLQLLGYMLKIWESNIKSRQALTPVVPIIFHHGLERWDRRPFRGSFGELDELLRPFVPEFDYLVVDTVEWSDQRVREMFSSLSLQIGMLLLKNIFDEVKLLRDLHEIFQNIQKVLDAEGGMESFESFVTYMFSATRLDMREVAERIRRVSPQGGQAILNGYEKAKQAGQNERAIKSALALIDLGLPNEPILRATDLGLPVLLELRALLAQGMSPEQILDLELG